MVAITSPGVEKEKGSITHMKIIKVFTIARRFKRVITGFPEAIVKKTENISPRKAASKVLMEARIKAKRRAKMSLARGSVFSKRNGLSGDLICRTTGSSDDAPVSSAKQLPHIIVTLL
jgi:hypothetical protein